MVSLNQQSRLGKVVERVKLEPSVGGDFYEPWGKDQLATGKVLLVKPYKKIRFTWSERSWKENQQTICEISLEESRGVTTLKVEHSGWEPFSNPKEMALGFGKGWDFFLSKLVKYIEG